MKSYSETDIFPPFILPRLRTAQKIVERIPDPGKREEMLRCHEVARIVGAILDYEVVDGQFAAVDHSWLEVPYRPARKRGEKVPVLGLILDVYAVGSLPQVKIVDSNSPLLPYRGLYVKGAARDDIRHWTVTTIFERLTVKDQRRICRDCLDKPATKTWPDHLRSGEEPTSYLCDDCQSDRQMYCSHPRFRRIDSHLPDECMVCGE